MSNARLISVEVERFKSYEAATRIDLAPLTVIVGRNNSGKSTLIQALLLLKQTLAHPRSDVPLHLEGPVDALTLRELTSFGWKQQGERVPGPRICVRWRSVVDVSAARERARHPNLDNLVRFTRIEWLTKPPRLKQLDTKLVLDLVEDRGRPVIEHVLLVSTDEEGVSHGLDVKLLDGQWRCAWDGQDAEHIEVEFDHFIPHLELDRDSLGPRHSERALHNGYLVLFEQPLGDLKDLLRDFLYLGSARTIPPALFKPSSVPPEDIGVSGEYAAQLIHSRRSDVVHYLPPVEIRGSEVKVSKHVRAQTFLEAINDVLSDLGVDAALRIEDIQNIGFRLLFGEVGLFHVGRGLTYLLPIIELCLFADPLRFEGVIGESGQQSIELYQSLCRGYAHLALEEPESHLHPKVQTRLAHWMVALAMANRRIIVETHSDHFVRRLRGLMARATPGSELEQWLRENVSIVEVEQDAEGRSSIQSSRLTPDGMLSEHWPSDFMDEASEEERAIYYASLDKTPSVDVPSLDGIEHDPGPEPEPESQP
jgi:predicted ATPase